MIKMSAVKIEGGGGQRFYLYIVKIENYLYIVKIENLPDF